MHGTCVVRQCTLRRVTVGFRAPWLMKGLLVVTDNNVQTRETNKNISDSWDLMVNTIADHHNHNPQSARYSPAKIVIQMHLVLEIYGLHHFCASWIEGSFSVCGTFPRTTRTPPMIMSSYASKQVSTASNAKSTSSSTTASSTLSGASKRVNADSTVTTTSSSGTASSISSQVSLSLFASLIPTPLYVTSFSTVSFGNIAYQ